MAVYYIANTGDDARDGTDPRAPRRSLQKLNAGDTVKFRRGDTFYGRIEPPPHTAYTSYGEGPKPVISQYKRALPSSWEAMGGNVWRLDLADIGAYTGNTTNIDANAGFLKVSGRIYAHKRFEAKALRQTWDFYNDERYVYVRAEKHPAELSDDIRIACNIGCMRFADNLRVSHLAFVGSGGHGISDTVRGASISDCEFHELGGSQLMGYERPDTRYGNGIECWSNSSDVTVERCRFSGIYDVAITMQGNKVERCWENMLFRDNVMWNNQQCFEIWSDGGKEDTGFKNCVFENNVCLDSGYCWGNAVRPDKNSASHLLIYGLGCPLCDVTVRNNLFGRALKTPIYKSGGPAAMPDDYKIYGNTFIVGEEQDIICRGGCPDGAYEGYLASITAANAIYTSAYST